MWNDKKKLERPELKMETFKVKVTLAEIAEKFGVAVEDIRIKEE